MPRKGYRKPGGVRRLSEYTIWDGMIGRCHRPNHPSYARYGGRGIFVCPEWRNSFREFYSYVGPRPSLQYQIDRINNDGNYEPGNVRWVLPDVQATNKGIQSNNSSGFRGVSVDYFNPNQWRAYISFGGRRFTLGVYQSKEEAAWMYDQWALSLYEPPVYTNLHYE